MNAHEVPTKPAVKLTILNSMAGADFVPALDQHLAWGIRHLDLKDGIFGKGIADLTPPDSARAAELIRQRGMQTYCLSTTLLHREVETGEAAFRADFAGLDRALATAAVLKAKVVRLLSAKTGKRGELADSIPYLQKSHPWLFDVYRAAAERIHAAGFVPMIENECGNNIFATPGEIVDFFAILNRPYVRLIWDIGNLWQVKTFPTLQVYQTLRPLIGSIHLKGGQAEISGGPLVYRAALQDTSWAVVDIVRQVVRDGVSPVICLNSPHGAAKPGGDYANLVARDIQFIRGQFPEFL